ncbi:MrcB family domain-containing protein [Nocardia cyriacigeorgica]|uniref:MrcB family domain-containing protein n=1 Tax=Nocardia cyriacigeorgica TaxID=135487 RepID=UPI0024585A3A|nr:DUF3578 domain-containing protein [Nocardia cyriacigeorgica]
MSLGEALNEVLTLQTKYTYVADDPAMRRRKELVEKTIPNLITAELADAFPGWAASGSGGKGASAEVPWSRYCNPSRSPAPTEGWYAVYLFDAAGQAVYLSLNQGTTTWDVDRQDFTYRSAQQLADRVGWARGVLAGSDTAPRVFAGIDLKARQRLGRIYQAGNVHGIRYEAGNLPSDNELRIDLVNIAQLLDQLYTAEAHEVYIPGDAVPEVVAAEIASSEAAGNTRHSLTKGRQGYRLNQDEKKAIELHAVALASEYFVSLGYQVKDTGATECYDLVATKNGEKIYVEVKGTASLGDQIIVTRAEVEHHQYHYPNNALVVVHSIKLDNSTGTPVASGGTRVVTHPWKIDESALTVISYRYALP